ncbi:hypothetical protein DF3PB_1340003 [uncultured Defluviicoccus sp.]|uniref:Uncharacterized protein n=1 Tax=metagenome TaxID=256318 RepID=A0A380T8U6_9ZZZZ|nr:hypothetical protein DF3PB_1340003 [uncultured Defluviicoccus sp.]
MASGARVSSFVVTRPHRSSFVAFGRVHFASDVVLLVATRRHRRIIRTPRHRLPAAKTNITRTYRLQQPL